MEKLFIGWFGGWALFVIPVFTGIITSFVIEAIDYLTPTELKAKWVVFMVALLAGVGLIFGFPNVAVEIFDKVIIGVLNVVFAIVFYKVGGKIVVKWIAEKAVGSIKTKAGN